MAETQAQPGAGATAPVADGKPTGPAATNPVSTSAVASVPLFGGLRGGRAREDGLIPGSAEAVEADREKDRVRKQAQRAAIAASKPQPTLPSVVPGANAPQAAVYGSTAGAVAVATAAVPWDAAMLKPLFDQLIPSFEELDVSSVIDQAGEAKLPPELVREIAKDARWSAPTKKALELSCPQVAAKWLNKTGISAENQGEVVLCSAIATLLVSRRMLTKRLEKLIAQRAEQQKAEPKEESK